MKISKILLKYLGYFAVLIIVQSCSVQTKKLNLTPDLDESFSAQGSLTQPAMWWLVFEDDKLNELISLGLLQNQSLRASLASVNRARASLGLAQSNKYPNLNLSAGTNTDIENLDGADTAFIGFTSNWEFDIWGRIEALEQKSSWDLEARKALYKARANTVAGAISTAWFGWLAQVDKQRLFNDQYKRTESALKVINRRFALGKNSVTDIWQQQRLLESIVAQQAVNDARLAIYSKQIALWVGVKSANLPQLNKASLPQVPDLPKLGVPLNTLQFRPDIQQAYASLQASNASLAAAATERFPRLSLRANYSTNKNNIKDLFDDWSGSLISSLAMPIFDAGATKAKVEQQEYQLEASFAEYKQTWFDAIFEVEQSLITEQQLAKVADNIAIQMDLAKKTERVISMKYLNGKSNYLNLLKAQETSLNLERQVVDAQFSLINNRISLYRELSHGNFTQDSDGDKETNFSAKTIIDENT
ncbi:TolC family protein [Thalassotalea fonticola]|uniref:TolC family protein n=1 Tax=Thalassotalea fonticola TaxID=3065649 RepID=A0ABZ0GK62_9GAMM|nr:TolC family protein [Colwelliaceae bacterium S1-1]